MDRAIPRGRQWPPRAALAALALALSCAARAPRALRPYAMPSPHGRAVVRVANLNAHLFFDTDCDTGRCAAGDFEREPSREEFEAQADELAHAVRHLDADVVCLQEVENEASLEALHRRLGPAWRAAVMGETGAPGSVDVAALARDPVVDVRRHRHRPLMRPHGTPTTFSRELLEVHLDHDGARVVVFCAHFRSKVRDDPGRRYAEAEAARDAVLATARELPSALVVLAGDLNDTPGSATLDALEGGGALVRVAASLPPEAQGTWVGREGAVAFDHLYVPAAVAPRVVPGSVRVVRDDDTPQRGRGYGGSDHAAIRADFTTP